MFGRGSPRVGAIASPVGADDGGFFSILAAVVPAVVVRTARIAALGVGVRLDGIVRVKAVAGTARVFDVDARYFAGRLARCPSHLVGGGTEAFHVAHSAVGLVADHLVCRALNPVAVSVGLVSGLVQDGPVLSVVVVVRVGNFAHLVPRLVQV